MYCRNGGKLVADNTERDSTELGKITKIHVQRLVHTLKVVHDTGIIHRDVCVANIFYLSDEQILLNDWGSRVPVNETTLYAGSPEPHIHPEIPLPSARHDLYSFASSFARLNNESRKYL